MHASGRNFLLVQSYDIPRRRLVAPGHGIPPTSVYLIGTFQPILKSTTRE